MIQKARRISLLKAAISCGFCTETLKLVDTVTVKAMLADIEMLMLISQLLP